MQEYFIFLLQIVQAEGNFSLNELKHNSSENIRSWKGAGKLSAKALFAQAT